jgi:hypothetical protein
MQTNLLRIITVGFDVRDQLLPGCFASVRYWRKNRSTMGQFYQLNCDEFTILCANTCQFLILKFEVLKSS